MRVLIVLALVAAAYANTAPAVDGNVPFSIIEKYLIPLGEQIRKAEEQMIQEQRIVGGVASNLGEFPYQAGLLSVYQGISGTGVCGGSLVSADRVITAAHCWFDGVNQAWRTTVVLGSITLFTGGTRMDTSVVALHPSWLPALIRNDVAVIYLPSPVTFSDTIAPIALPTASEADELFVGASAVASGFGLTVSGGSISNTQFLSHVTLNVISNNVCRYAFPLILSNSNICTSGLGGSSTCSGDSGGPLAVNHNGRRILIGITSFGSALGCDIGMPAAFARVTSFLDFFNEHI